MGRGKPVYERDGKPVSPTGYRRHGPNKGSRADGGSRAGGTVNGGTRAERVRPKARPVTGSDIRMYGAGSRTSRGRRGSPDSIDRSPARYTIADLISAATGAARASMPAVGNIPAATIDVASVIAPYQQAAQGVNQNALMGLAELSKLGQAGNTEVKLQGQADQARLQDFIGMQQSQGRRAEQQLRTDQVPDTADAAAQGLDAAALRELAAQQGAARGNIATARDSGVAMGEDLRAQGQLEQARRAEGERAAQGVARTNLEGNKSQMLMQLALQQAQAEAQVTQQNASASAEAAQANAAMQQEQQGALAGLPSEIVDMVMGTPGAFATPGRQGALGALDAYEQRHEGGVADNIARTVFSDPTITNEQDAMAEIDQAIAAAASGDRPQNLSREWFRKLASRYYGNDQQTLNPQVFQQMLQEYLLRLPGGA